MIGSWSVPYFLFTLSLTSAAVFDDTTAASNASTYSRVARSALASSASFGSLWPATTVVGFSALISSSDLIHDFLVSVVDSAVHGWTPLKTMSPVTTVLIDGIQTYELSAESPVTCEWTSSV